MFLLSREKTDKTRVDGGDTNVSSGLVCAFCLGGDCGSVPLICCWCIL